MHSFAGSRLTFLKLWWGLVSVPGIFFKASGSQILAFQCDKEF